VSKLWKPSNSSEGDFMWSFPCLVCYKLIIQTLCGHFERDRASWPIDQGGQDSPENGCIIIAEFGCNGEHKAWIIGDDGKPRCTQFVEEGKEIFEEDTETLPLFPEI